MNSAHSSGFRHMTMPPSLPFTANAEEKAEPVDTTSAGLPVTEALRALQIGEEQRAESRQRTVRRKRPAWWMTGLALGVLVAAGVTWLTLRPRPVPVQVMTVIPTSPASRGFLTAGGYVRHARVVNVVSRVSGILATLRVAEGDVVHEGDLIATIDGDELAQQVVESRADLRAEQAQLAELEAGHRREEIASSLANVAALRLTAERLQRESERSRALVEKGAVSAQDFERAEDASLVASKNLEAAQQGLALLEAGPRPEAIARARAAIDAASARLARAVDYSKRTEIRAPLSGRVLRKFLDVGSVVSFGLPYTEGYNTLGPGSPIVAIGQLEGLEAVADINETDLGRLSLGEEVEVSAEAFPGKTYQATVARFSPRADRNKNTVEVSVRFADPVPIELAHDMSVKLSFVGNDRANPGLRERLWRSRR